MFISSNAKIKASMLERPMILKGDLANIRLGREVNMSDQEKPAKLFILKHMMINMMRLTGRGR